MNASSVDSIDDVATRAVHLGREFANALRNSDHGELTDSAPVADTIKHLHGRRPFEVADEMALDAIGASLADRLDAIYPGRGQPCLAGDFNGHQFGNPIAEDLHGLIDLLVNFRRERNRVLDWCAAERQLRRMIEAM